MKKQFLLLSLLLGSITITNAADIEFEDANFKAALIAEGIDENEDNEISEEEAEAIQVIDIAGNGFNFTNISGIEYFTNLEALNITSNDFLKEVDVSKNTKLITLRLYYATSVTDVDVSGCTELKVLDLGSI